MDYKKCFCCGSKTIPENTIFRVCPVCGWQDDEVQNLDADYDGGANHFSLTVAKKAFAEGKSLQRLQAEGWGKFQKEQARFEC